MGFTFAVRSSYQQRAAAYAAFVARCRLEELLSYEKDKLLYRADS